MNAAATRRCRTTVTAVRLAPVCALVLALGLRGPLQARQLTPLNPTVDQGAEIGLAYGTCGAQGAPVNEWQWNVTGPAPAAVQGGPDAYTCWLGVFLAPYTPGAYQFTLTRFGMTVGTTTITVNPVTITLSGQPTLYENWTTQDAVTATMTGMGSPYSSDYAMTWSISPLNDMILIPGSTNGLSVQRETITSGLTPGGYLITVTSVKEPAVSGRMVVTVVAPQVSVSPTSVVAIPGQTIDFVTTSTNTPIPNCTFSTDDPWTDGFTNPGTLFPFVHLPGKPGGLFHIFVEGGWGGSATTTVTVVAVTLTPATITVLPGTSRQFLAEVTGSQQAIQWSTTVPGATISSAGLLAVPAGTPLGSYTVTAQTVGNPVSPATATVTVANLVPVTSVVISPARSVIDSGQQELLSAAVLGQNDEPDPNQGVSWSVAGPAAVAMAANGLFSAPATPGIYTVTATSQADPTKSGTATVTVGEALLILPSSASLPPGASQAFTAQVSGVANPAVTWNVMEGTAGGSITATGLYTAPPAPGVYHIGAVSAAAGETVQAIVPVLVGARPEISVSVAPSEVELTAGATQQFMAQVEGVADTAVLWSASAGQIDATGLFTAPASYGSVTITAISHADGTTQGSATAVVSSAAQGQAFQYDANGNLLADGARTFEWDAENRMTAIDVGTHRSEFGYDGLGRRVLITEKDNGAVTSSHHYLWIGDQMVEETDATTAPSTSPPAIGSFDAIDCNQLAGWAWDPTRPNTPINVDVYDGSTKIATFLANAFRADVRATGAGNGDHAFFIPTPAALKTGAAHGVTVKIGGTATVLGTRSVTCAAPSFVGFFDSANCNQLAGWAADGSQLNSPIDVDVDDGSTLIATVLANVFRQDLLNAGLGNGVHGYVIPTPAALKTGTTHTVTIKAGGTATVVGGARTLSCPAPSFIGYLDSADCTQLVGWAWDGTQPNSPISVDVYDGTSFIASVLANTFRQDLKNAGFGNGSHGFVYTSPAFYTGGSHTITIRYGGTVTPLGETPRAMTCPNETVLSRFFPGGMQSGGASFYFSYDHLGSVREVTDVSGNVVSRYDYDPYGRLTINQGSPPRFGFGGYFYHSPSGLSLTQYRAFDPDTGRWESRDPLPTYGGFLNLYEYSNSDPVNQYDADGAAPSTPPAPPSPLPPGYGPTGPNGQPIGLPPGNWVWSSNPKDGRGGKWYQPGNSGPNASWDRHPKGPAGPGGGQKFGEPHWDYNDGHGNKCKFDIHGKPMPEDKAHPPNFDPPGVNWRFPWEPLGPLVFPILNPCLLMPFSPGCPQAGDPDPGAV